MAPAGGYCYSGDVGGEEVGGVAPKKHSGGEEGKIKGGGARKPGDSEVVKVTWCRFFGQNTRAPN